ncbi:MULTISPECIES: MazG family protein [unclassified Leifsonia]|uniref:MazG family protein n=1 Tax=unclassified Leifsonia TaxID=2663824 RepID=UPI0008A7903A|nr:MULTISPECIES: MazG family protein [unclassified Leifsonia]SEI03822.1 XTP/dITP diphosphohydrolase [Leifsonia sp. CL154]SFL73550.1 XTP/dITP diphosphohydrolase [Leifsonia sp. CL147]
MSDPSIPTAMSTADAAATNASATASGIPDGIRDGIGADLSGAPTRLDELVAVMARLRAAGGCPWDADQTHESLVQYLIEETYELIDAIETGDRDELLEELGDVLYQVLFHADIAAHTPGEEFDIQDVAAHMTAKMVGRHPHVFGDRTAPSARTAETAQDVVGFWDDLKKQEKPGRTSVLDGIPQGMPSLALADKLLGRAEKVGLLDLREPGGVQVGSEDELGALLLAIVASSKAQGMDAERALRSTLRELQGEIREHESADQESPARESAG